MSRDEMLRHITALDFYIIDLGLYLNTHPMDAEALDLYNTSVRKAMEMRMDYTKQYGMLLANSSESKLPWQWIENPWPWQKSFNFVL